MATTYTTNCKMAKSANGDPNWDTPIRANYDYLDAVSAVGSLVVAATETPSASLNVRVSAGSFRSSVGLFTAYAGISSQTLAASATNSIYLTDAAILTVSTSGFPATAHVPLATVTTGGSTVSSIVDARKPFSSGGVSLSTVYLALAGGSFDDTSGVVTVHTGTTNGTKIGGTTGEKIGFWSATPVIQPSGANQAAITDSSTGTASFTIAAISDTATANAVASLARQLAAIRSALIAIGAIKGSS